MSLSTAGVFFAPRSVSLSGPRASRLPSVPKGRDGASSRTDGSPPVAGVAGCATGPRGPRHGSAGSACTSPCPVVSWRLWLRNSPLGSFKPPRRGPGRRSGVAGGLLRASRPFSQLSAFSVGTIRRWRNRRRPSRNPDGHLRTVPPRAAAGSGGRRRTGATPASPEQRSASLAGRSDASTAPSSPPSVVGRRRCLRRPPRDGCRSAGPPSGLRNGRGYGNPGSEETRKDGRRTKRMQGTPQPCLSFVAGVGLVTSSSVKRWLKGRP